MMNVKRGSPYPLGATVHREGVNFALFSRHATAIQLELFSEPTSASATAVIALDPQAHRTGDIWHVFVEELHEGALYGFRVFGPYQPERGDRFNPHKLLLDPYAKSYAGMFHHDHEALYGFERANDHLSFNRLDSAPYVPKSVVVGPSRFDWQGDQPLRRSWSELVIYEMHVRGFTKHPSSGVSAPGTFAAIVEKIPYLRELGVTAVELLPVHFFNHRERTHVVSTDPDTCTNYWGYAPLGFFAPMSLYAAASLENPVAAIDEFKFMVRELHRAGIEVILDVVFNHTGENGEHGITCAYRGLDNAVYYRLDADARYRNDSGCGNTLNTCHPIVKQLILDSLRYWAVEMHVDGFRFDLATILGRDRHGNWVSEGLVSEISDDPYLQGCKFIAEPWDVGGLYLLGKFPSEWAEWNDRFRDDLRRFVRGDEGMVSTLSRRIRGSDDLLGAKAQRGASINFVTAHDGFTLRDLVSYEHKRNEKNGEENRDGATHNFSFNCGIEGETTERKFRAQRRKQAKNLLTLLLLSRGTPMLRAGDERWQTQHGNNNAYCQDNELSWIDWRTDDEGDELLRVTKNLIALRHRYRVFHRLQHEPSWHGVLPEFPDWNHHSHSLAFRLFGDTSVGNEPDFYGMLNAWHEALTFVLPTPKRGQAWHRVIDTSLDPPNDILEVDSAKPYPESVYRVSPNSVVVLVEAPLIPS